MLVQIINMLWEALDTALTWLMTLLDSVGDSVGFGLSLISAFVVMGAIYKYIISPYITGSGSDKANKKKGK